MILAKARNGTRVSGIKVLLKREDQHFLFASSIPATPSRNHKLSSTFYSPRKYYSSRRIIWRWRAYIKPTCLLEPFIAGSSLLFMSLSLKIHRPTRLFYKFEYRSRALLSLSLSLSRPLVSRGPKKYARAFGWREKNGPRARRGARNKSRLSSRATWFFIPIIFNPLFYPRINFIRPIRKLNIFLTNYAIAGDKVSEKFSWAILKKKRKKK